MATKNEARIIRECRESLAKDIVRRLLRAELIETIGVVNWAVRVVTRSADPIRKGMFAAAWCLAAGGTAEEAALAEQLADARHARFLDRIIAQQARRGGNVYEVSGPRRRRKATRVAAAVFRRNERYTIYCSGFCVRAAGTFEIHGPTKYEVR